MGFEWTFAVNAYGDKWRKRRRVFRSHLHQGVSHVYEGIQILEARRFLQQLLHKPNDLHELSRGCAARKIIRLLSHANWLTMRRFIGATVMNIAYGVEVTGPQDPYITIADEVVREFSSAMFPGSFLIDYIPACKSCSKSLAYLRTETDGLSAICSFMVSGRWLQKIRRESTSAYHRDACKAAQRGEARHGTLLATFINAARSRIIDEADGTCKPCLVSRMLSNMPEHSNSQEVEQLISDSAGNMYQGALRSATIGGWC